MTRGTSSRPASTRTSSCWWTSGSRAVRTAGSSTSSIADLNKGRGSAIGYEYQILDDAVHPDAKKGQGRGPHAGFVIRPDSGGEGQACRGPIGEWNTARIVVRGAHVEHWLNGVKVVEYERFTPAVPTACGREQVPRVARLLRRIREGNILLQGSRFSGFVPERQDSRSGTLRCGKGMRRTRAPARERCRCVDARGRGTRCGSGAGS